MSFVWSLVFLFFFCLGIYALLQLLFLRALYQVIGCFRKEHALCSESPKIPREIGIHPIGYRFRALRMLIDSGAVRVFEDGSACLVDETIPGFLDGTKGM